MPEGPLNQADQPLRQVARESGSGYEHTVQQTPGTNE